VCPLLRNPKTGAIVGRNINLYILVQDLISDHRKEKYYTLDISFTHTFFSAHFEILVLHKI
jgi:hypothetical protein